MIEKFKEQNKIMGTQETVKKKPKKPTSYSLLWRSNRRICRVEDLLFEIKIDVNRHLRLASELSLGHGSAIKSIDKLQGELYLLTQKLTDLTQKVTDLSDLIKNKGTKCQSQ
jgi:hypothetical protein